jgi:uncharacterized protein (DUF1810 family)
MDDLERFVSAQRDSYAIALAEIAAGRKRSHWMWFVFPQLAGLGSSAMARRYAISGLTEARAYLAHPVLGPRLHECVATLMALPTRDAVEVFGGIDAMKLRSSLTLFEAGGDGAMFGDAIDGWFAGERDPMTLRLLGGSGGGT